MAVDLQRLLRHGVHTGRGAPQPEELRRALCFCNGRIKNSQSPLECIVSGASQNGLGF